MDHLQNQHKQQQPQANSQGSHQKKRVAIVDHGDGDEQLQLNTKKNKQANQTRNLKRPLWSNDLYNDKMDDDGDDDEAIGASQ